MAFNMMTSHFTGGSHLAQYCTLYGNGTHIANTRYRTSLAKKGVLGPHKLQSNKVSDSINYHFIKHHAWVRMSTFRKR